MISDLFNDHRNHVFQSNHPVIRHDHELQYQYRKNDFFIDRTDN